MTKSEKPQINPAEFRRELQKIMPGYKWTVHRKTCFKENLAATGIMSSGFNRISTLRVEKTIQGDKIEYEASSSGYGRAAPWLATYVADTLARALRHLQEHHERMAHEYLAHYNHLQQGRKTNKGVLIIDRLEPVK